MTFAWPHLLWLLVLPALLGGIELGRKRRSGSTLHPKILQGEAGTGEVILSGTAEPIGRQRAKIWFCAGLALSILALARPQWGKIDEPVFDQSREIILALDLSRSMTTPDVKPTRLDRAKLLIQSLLDHLNGERVGMIEFSGTAFLQAPLSADYEVLREFLPSLGPDTMPEGGTNYGQLLEVAADSFQGSGSADRFLIILSDGEATDEDWRANIGKLKEKGIRVIGLGVGTHAGGMIPDGAGGFLKDDDGAVVLSKLESKTLRELAEATGGAYNDASAWVDLPALLKSTVEAAKSGRFLEHTAPRYAERFQWALAPALLCLLVSFLRELPVRPKPRAIGFPALSKHTKEAAAVMAFFASFVLLHADEPGEDRDPSAMLSRVVGRLSAKAACDALDWAELGNETVSWGQHLQSAGQPVAEGPVRDALAAAKEGEQANPSAANWPQIKANLTALLKKQDDQKNKPPPEQKPQKDQKDSKDSKGSNDSQDSKNSKADKQNASPQNQKKEGSKADNPEGQQPPKQSGPQGDRPKPKQSAFGEMKDHAQSGALQKIGGEAQERPDPAAKDPALAIPLERLQQLKDQDSPAELFELIQRGEPTPPSQNKGKNW